MFVAYAWDFDFRMNYLEQHKTRICSYVLLFLLKIIVFIISYCLILIICIFSLKGSVAEMIAEEPEKISGQSPIGLLLYVFIYLFSLKT